MVPQMENGHKRTKDSAKIFTFCGKQPSKTKKMNKPSVDQTRQILKYLGLTDE